MKKLLLTTLLSGCIANAKSKEAKEMIDFIDGDDKIHYFAYQNSQPCQTPSLMINPICLTKDSHMQVVLMTESGRKVIEMYTNAPISDDVSLNISDVDFTYLGNVSDDMDPVLGFVNSNKSDDVPVTNKQLKEKLFEKFEEVFRNNLYKDLNGLFPKGQLSDLRLIDFEGTNWEVDSSFERHSGQLNRNFQAIKAIANLDTHAPASLFGYCHPTEDCIFRTYDQTTGLVNGYSFKIDPALSTDADLTSLVELVASSGINQPLYVDLRIAVETEGYLNIPGFVSKGVVGDYGFNFMQYDKLSEENLMPSK